MARSEALIFILASIDTIGRVCYGASWVTVSCQVVGVPLAGDNFQQSENCDFLVFYSAFSLLVFVGLDLEP